MLKASCKSYQHFFFILLFKNYKFSRERKSFINRFANNVVDGVLTEVRGYVRRQRLSVIGIPDYETKFSQAVGPVTFSGGFHAIFGEARNLSTVKRTSDFNISVNNKTGLVTIFGGIGLDELNVSFFF